MKNKSKTTTIRWRTILGLIFMYIAMWFDWQWAWGLLFLMWVVPDLFSGVTYFIEPIERAKEPILYWVIIVSWIIMSIYSISTLIFPELKYYQ